MHRVDAQLEASRRQVGPLQVGRELNARLSELVQRVRASSEPAERVAAQSRRREARQDEEQERIDGELATLERQGGVKDRVRAPQDKHAIPERCGRRRAVCHGLDLRDTIACPTRHPRSSPAERLPESGAKLVRTCVSREEVVARAWPPSDTLLANAVRRGCVLEEEGLLQPVDDGDDASGSRLLTLIVRLVALGALHAAARTPELAVWRPVEAVELRLRRQVIAHARPKVVDRKALYAPALGSLRLGHLGDALGRDGHDLARVLPAQHGTGACDVRAKSSSQHSQKADGWVGERLQRPRTRP